MRKTTIPALLLATWLSGCSALGGSQGSTRSTTASKLAQAQAAHEYPSPPSTPQTATGAATGPIAAIRSFAGQYINWQADTVTERMRTLAAESVGQARAEMELTAAHTAGDYELQRGGIANSGTDRGDRAARQPRTPVCGRHARAHDCNCHIRIRRARACLAPCARDRRAAADRTLGSEQLAARELTPTRWTTLSARRSSVVARSGRQ